MNAVGLVLAWISLLGAALIAGAFFVFSAMVMPALRRLAPAEGIRAMQSINEVAVRPPFLGVFLGTGLTSFAVVIIAVLDLNRFGHPWLLAAGLLYVVGTVVVTMIFNVPLNNSLAAATADDTAAHALWQRYLRAWTAWNSARAMAALAAVAGFVIALAD